MGGAPNERPEALVAGMAATGEEGAPTFWQANWFSVTVAVLCLAISLAGMAYIIATDVILTLGGPVFLLGMGIGVIVSAAYCIYQYDGFLMYRRFEAMATAQRDRTKHRRMEVTAKVKVFNQDPDVQLHYRQGRENDFSSIRMSPKAKQLFTAVLDPDENEDSASDSVQYYISVHVDGERKRDAAYDIRATPAPQVAPPPESSQPAPPARPRK